MPFGRDIVLVGVSHRTAPLVVRERCVIPREAVPERLRGLKERFLVRESWILGTCNRTEVLVLAGDQDVDVTRLKGDVFPGGTPLESVYAHQGVEAVFHLFRVASGLDSQVLGETQILAQIKEATAIAREGGAVQSTLGSLLDHALQAGKRVRSGTRLGEGTLSVAKAAVDLSRKVLGSLKSTRALLIGAGETGLLVAKHLKDEGCRDLNFTNRTAERADAAAREFGGTARPLERLADFLSDMDLTVISVDGSQPLVLPSHLDPARLRRHDRPPLLVDLSVPRAIDPALKGHPDLFVNDLDDLDNIVGRHRVERQAEIEAAGRIVVEETHKWFGQQTYAAFTPTITGLVARFEEIRSEVLAQHGGVGHDWGSFSEKLTRRLLDLSLGTLKEGARQTLPEDQFFRHYKEWLSKS